MFIFELQLPFISQNSDLLVYDSKESYKKSEGKKERKRKEEKRMERRRKDGKGGESSLQISR
jgi:hypothetical protein